MPGQIIKRGDRKWLVRVYYGRDAEGRRVYRSKLIHGTKRDAETYLAEALRMRDLAGTAVAGKRTLMADLFEDLLADYLAKGQSYDWAERYVRLHLKPAFGHLRAGQVTTALIRRYIAARQEAGAAPATINRELALLKRAFRLGAAHTPPKVATVPYIPMLKEENARQGFLEHDEYEALVTHMPPVFRAIVAFGYYTGCRRNEILTLGWSQVDLAAGIVRLEARMTKTGEPRTVALSEDLRQLLAFERARADQYWPDCPWVFTEDGTKPVNGDRLTWVWRVACRAAGLWKDGRPTKVFHDLRRTAVRNMIRAGVPERIAMSISGHKTRAIFDRYNIVSEADLRQAAARLERYLAERREEAQRGERHTIGTPSTEGPIQ